MIKYLLYFVVLFAHRDFIYGYIFQISVFVCKSIFVTLSLQWAAVFHWPIITGVHPPAVYGFIAGWTGNVGT